MPGSPLDRSRCTASRHGTMSAYTRAGCRCADAREAKRLYVKRQRVGRPEIRRVDATGARRRIRALMALGHTMTVIGRTAGITPDCVSQVANQRRWLAPATHAKIVAAYDRLSMVVGGSPRIRRYARDRGWPPPLAWEDGTIDDPAARPVFGRTLRCEPTRTAESMANRRDRIHDLWRQGFQDRDIVAVVGGEPNAVKKLRLRHGWTRPQNVREEVAV